MKGLVDKQVNACFSFFGDVMEKHIFKKKFGQNFLQDEKVLLDIARSINATSRDLIVEVGPGAGALTKHLVNIGPRVVAFEIDESLDKELSLLSSSNLDVIFKDFMSVDLDQELQKYDFENLYLLANLPYYITTPILEKVMECGVDFKEVVVMVQDEVAHRLTSCAGSSEFGAFTVLLDCFYDREYLFFVDRKAFYPIPNVDSAVIKCSRRDSIKIDFSKFKKFVFDCFKFKRKNLRNNLKGYNLELVDSILKRYGFSLNNRAEEIDTLIFIEIFNSLK